MYFTKVELHNFGIYKGTHEMCLTDRVNGRNITLVGGLNGRGKTTFHDAILLALYGKQALKYIQERTRSYDRLLLDHMNRHATDAQTYVAVSLCLDDGTLLRVKRSWTAKGSKADQQVLVEKNGVADPYLSESWSYYIEEILPFGIARFFFFNNEKITQIADDASFEQLKSSIKSAIGVSTIEKAIAHTEEVIRRKRNDLAAFQKSEENAAYQQVEAQIGELERQLEEAARQGAELESRREAIAEECETREQEFWAAGGDLIHSGEWIRLRMQELSADVERGRGEIQQLAGEASTPLYLCRELVVQSYETEIELRQSEAKRYSDHVITDLCGQIMDRLSESGLEGGAIEVARGIVNDVLGGHAPEKESQPPARNVSATSMMLYERVISQVFQSLGQRIHTLTGLVGVQESELANLAAYRDTAAGRPQAMQKLEDLKAAQSKRALIEAECKRHTGAVESLQHQHETLLSRRTQLAKTLAEREMVNDENARIVKYAAMSIEVLRAFKVRLQREKLLKLSQTATDCFQALVEKASMVSSITIDPETLDVAILGTDGRELFKSQLSAGEQQMFAVAIVWALALTSGYKAPVVIDTPMARLDSAHRVNFLTKYLPAASSQVLILSTDAEVYGQYLDLIRGNVVDCYTLLYNEEEQCTAIAHGYFGEEVAADDR